MVLFDKRPPFEKAWLATSFCVIMAGMGDDTVSRWRIIIFGTNSGQTQRQKEYAAEKQ